MCVAAWRDKIKTQSKMPEKSAWIQHRAQSAGQEVVIIHKIKHPVNFQHTIARQSRGKDQVVEYSKCS